MHHLTFIQTVSDQQYSVYDGDKLIAYLERECDGNAFWRLKIGARFCGSPEQYRHDLMEQLQVGRYDKELGLLPPSVDLRDPRVKIFDQGELGSATACASVSASMIQQLQKGLK